jgi:hypothetical protein
MIVLLQKIQIALVIENRQRVIPPLILQVRPGVLPGQVDYLAITIGEVTRVNTADL